MALSSAFLYNQPLSQKKKKLPQISLINADKIFKE